MTDQPTMTDFVKALADADRLRIIGALSQRSARAEEIAAGLNMPMRDAYNHLCFLVYVGALTETDGVYAMRPDGIENIARAQLQEERPTYAPAPDLDPATRKVLITYLNADGSIKQIPSQPAKLNVILAYIAQAFTPGVNYTEKEVNTILRRFNIDTAGLRRDLIDAGMLKRISDGSRYWREIA
jgi:hypothetical protein